MVAVQVLVPAAVQVLAVHVNGTMVQDVPIVIVEFLILDIRIVITIVSHQGITTLEHL
jgi:hypothetical protein